MTSQHVVGVVWSGFPQPWQQALLDRLRQRYTIEARYAQGKGPPELERFADELVGRRVDVLVAGDTPAALTLKKTTGAIPIVIAASTDCVATGLVLNPERPEGNVTGLTGHLADDDRLLILLDLLRANGRDPSPLGVLWNDDNPGKRLESERTLASAQGQEPPLHVQRLVVSGPEYDFEAAFRGAVSPAALVVLEDPITLHHRSTILELAARYRVPAIYESRAFVDNGGLMCYGADRFKAYARAAAFVETILERGLRPGNLPPVAQLGPDLAVNRETASGLGLTVIPKQLRGATPEVV